MAGQVSSNGSIVLSDSWNDRVLMIRYHLKFYNILFKGWLIVAASCGRGDIITSFFSQSFNPVVKGAGIDVMFRTPLVVTKTAAAAL